MFRENRVPHYQRLFQKKDGIADRWKVRAESFLGHHNTYDDDDDQHNCGITKGNSRL